MDAQNISHIALSGAIYGYFVNIVGKLMVLHQDTAYGSIEMDYWPTDINPKSELITDPLNCRMRSADTFGYTQPIRRLVQ